MLEHAFKNSALKLLYGCEFNLVVPCLVHGDCSVLEEPSVLVQTCFSWNVLAIGLSGGVYTNLGLCN